MSTAPEVGRDAPRWSVVILLTAVPAPMAALPGKQRHGFSRSAVVAEWGQAQLGDAGTTMLSSAPFVRPPDPPVPIRLYELDPATLPAMSLAELPLPVLPATIVFCKVAVPLLYRPPPFTLA